MPPPSNKNLYISSAIALQTGSLFGYAVGYIGGTLVLPSFQHHFHLSHLAPADLAAVQARLVLCWILGAAFGVPVGIPVCQRLGRRVGLVVSAALFVLGAALQVVDYEGAGQLALFEVGRALNGLGVGVGSLVTPMYIAETSPSHLRAPLMSAYQLSIQTFALFGFWSAYASHALFPSPTSPLQWRIPVAFQLLPGIALLAGAFYVPETPRFYAERGRWAEAGRVLGWFRGMDEEGVQGELEGVRSAIAARARMEEARGGESFWSEVRKGDVKRRLHVGVGLMVGNNILGLNAINYAPVIFMSAGFTSVSSSLFLSGLFGVVKLISALVFMFYSVKVRGNRFWLKLGCGVCAFSMLVLAFCINRLTAGTQHPAIPTEGAPTLNGIVSVLMVYLFTLFFGLSIGPISWNVCAEIFPLHINARCCAITTCTQWIFQMVVASATPLLIARTGWVTYLIYGVCCIVTLVWVTFVVPETRGVPVGKEMDTVFGKKEEEEEESGAEAETAPLLQNEYRRTSVVSYT